MNKSYSPKIKHKSPKYIKKAKSYSPKIKKSLNKISQNKFTGNIDIDIVILASLDDKSFNMICKSNKYVV